MHGRLTRIAGKRFNVLHRRTDSWHYEVDQLILGTLLFTLFTFGLPTLLTYGIVFALVCNPAYERQINNGFITRATVDEVSCPRHQVLVECGRQADEPLSTFCSFAENKGSKETTWFVFTTS